MPSRNPIVRNKTNATRTVVVQAGRKNNRGKAVSVMPTYTVGLVKRKKNKNSKNQNRNSKNRADKEQGRQRPATRSPIESSTVRLTSSTPDLSLNLRGDLTDPLAEARDRKMSSLFEQYPKIQRIYPAPLQANGTYLRDGCMFCDSFCSVLFVRLVWTARQLPLFRRSPLLACRVCIVELLFRSWRLFNPRVSELFVVTFVA